MVVPKLCRDDHESLHLPVNLETFNSDCQTHLDESEISALERLAASTCDLDTRTDVGLQACETFLSSIEATQTAFKLAAISRSYRSSFSMNYRSIFPSTGRDYHVDLLRATADDGPIWVNGYKFEFSAEASYCGAALRNAFNALCGVLSNCGVDSLILPPRAELVAALLVFDCAWASFEYMHITELMDIEEQARRHIWQAVEYEARLRNPALQQRSAKYQRAQRCLVRSICHLNALANYRRKGRDDLDCDILTNAHAVLRLRSASPVHVLAKDVIDTFDSMCVYLREVGKFLEHVDPQLCNNDGLVARLADWEETWEVGARYLRDSLLREALCDQLKGIQAIQERAPILTSMIDERSVELFFALPRIILLTFLADPGAKSSEVMRSLLPDHFIKTGTVNSDTEVETVAASSVAVTKPDPELQCLINHYDRTIELVSGEQASVYSAWEVLVRRAVSGPGSMRDAPCHERPLPIEKAQAVEELMHEAERWSLELQRRSPEEWNQCSAMFVQCLTGGTRRQASAKFHI